ncbi:MAG: cbb3-type cytochrome c oxidase subunit I, partial [Planctomycetota bacterium]
MTTLASPGVHTDLVGKPVLDTERKHYLNHSKGFLSWALTLDHKRIAIMYLVGVLAAFLLGGVMAIVLRTMLLWNTDTLAGEAVKSVEVVSFYNQAFTIHGAVMVFMFIIPAIPGVIGNFVLPMMVGAIDVAFPRLNLLSFYCWLV